MDVLDYNLFRQLKVLLKRIESRITLNEYLMNSGTKSRALKVLESALIIIDGIFVEKYNKSIIQLSIILLDKLTEIDSIFGKKMDNLTYQIDIKQLIKKKQELIISIIEMKQ